MTETDTSLVGHRLLSINNYFYRRGGAEAVFFEHNAMLETAGWDVVPFSMHHPENQPSHWSDYFIDEIEYGRAGTIFQKAKQAAKIIYSFEARQKLDRLLQVAPPSIAHAHNVYHHISPAVFSLLKDRGIPVVMTVHDLKIACPAYKMLREGRVCEDCKSGAIYNVVRHKCIKDSRLLSSLVFTETLVHRMLGLYRSCVDRFVVPSRFYLEKLVEWGWPREKLVYIPNAIELQDNQPTRAKKDYVLFAGRLSPEKGIDTLIRAAADASVKVIVAGTGPEEHRLKSLANELTAPVEFAGYVSGAQLFELIGEARALALPSVWYENAPISVLEAYQCGTPVLGADIGGIPEMILPEKTGLVVASGDSEAWTDALKKISTETDRSLLEMGEAGRRFAAAHFSKAGYRKKMEDLYRELIADAA